jgi:hypothetical protein
MKTGWQDESQRRPQAGGAAVGLRRGRSPFLRSGTVARGSTFHDLARALLIVGMTVWWMACSSDAWAQTSPAPRLLPPDPAARPALERPPPNPRPPAAFSVQVDTPALILRSETRSVQLEVPALILISEKRSVQIEVPALILYSDRTKARR